MLFTLAFGLLQALLWAGPSLADDHALRVQDHGVTRHCPVADRIAAIGLTELRVANDPHFGPDRVFAGFASKPLLEHVGLGDAAELLLVCADGYNVPFDAAVLSRPALRAVLAIRDEALPTEGEAHWAPFRHGTQIVSFNPFYRVWASADEDEDLGTEAMPWPFQLTEIRRFDRARHFAPAQPRADAHVVVRKGFEVYAAHSSKCHRVRGVGDDVGPALDRDAGLSRSSPRRSFANTFATTRIDFHARRCRRSLRS